MATEETSRISPHMKANLEEVHRRFGQSDDLTARHFVLGLGSGQAAAVVYLEGTVDQTAVSEQVLQPLTLDARCLAEGAGTVSDMRRIGQFLVSVTNVTAACDWTDLIVSLPDGAAVLFIDGVAEALVLKLRANLGRAIDEPESSPVVRGPREGFVETLHTNLALVRRRIRTSDLRVRILTVGRRTQTKVAVLYVEGVAEEGIVKEALRRIERIEIDGVLESGYIEEMIQDHPYALFPTIRHTERVDVVLGSLLEGRVAIMTDGTPFVLIVPTSFAALLQVSEDYYERWPIGTFIRLVRFSATLVSMALTAFYVAIISYNQELIPIGLLLRLVGSRTGLPFPALVEAILLESAFEILREAGLRMPRPIGQAISIVGVLVLGEAAVRAGIVGPTMIIVVGASALASFGTPDYSMVNSFRIARFGVLLVAGTFGLYGLMWALLLIATHLLTLRSFGVPYMTPLAPTRGTALFRDVIARTPWPRMVKRPSWVSRNSRRLPPGQLPGPNRDGGNGP